MLGERNEEDELKLIKKDLCWLNLGCEFMMMMMKKKEMDDEDEENVEDEEDDEDDKLCFLI